MLEFVMATLVIIGVLIIIREDSGVCYILSGKMTKGSAKSACWDVHSNQDVTIYPNESVVVTTGIKTEMYGCDVFLFDRSGLAMKRITRRAGVIDEDYPGEWGVVLVNEGREPMIIKNGDRIAQAFFVPKNSVSVVAKGGEVVETYLQRTGGFGSTGH